MVYFYMKTCRLAGSMLKSEKLQCFIFALHHGFWLPVLLLVAIKGIYD